MKVLVCCMIIVANISSNGKASLDSFVPASMNILLEDTTKGSDTSCYRPCKFNVKPRRCHYHFKIEPSILEDGKSALTVNGLSPGPSINVCVNDVIVVEVQNKIPDQDIAIHWHGVEQKGTPWMDGVPMITQCPIAYGSTYKYAFIANSPGTFFYHSDSVSHQGDGVYGPLIVNQPQPLEPHSSLYDYDRSKEHTLTVAARFPELLTGNLEVNNVRPHSLIVNGVEDSSKLFVTPGFAYRIRLINAIAIECPVTMSIYEHEMIVIASDVKPVQLVSTRKVKLYPGERMDVVVRASQKPGGYWMELRAEGACAELVARTMFIYSGFNYTSMLLEPKILTNPDAETNAIAINGQSLKSLQEVSHIAEVKKVFLGINKNIVKFNDTDIDFRYISDAIAKRPFFPASMSLQERGVVQINGKNFLYPSTPALLKPREDKSDVTCAVGKEEDQKEPQCMQSLSVKTGEMLEIALVNEGIGNNDSYTFHLHGYSMQVIATWEKPDKTPLTKEEFKRYDKGGKVLRNLQNPPFKDTVTVPNKGYTIVRIRPDHGGSWLLECRSCGFSSLPAAILINVHHSIPKPVIDSLPKCGNYRPPDVLLN